MTLNVFPIFNKNNYLLSLTLVTHVRSISFNVDLIIAFQPASWISPESNLEFRKRLYAHFIGLQSKNASNKIFRYKIPN